MSSTTLAPTLLRKPVLARELALVLGGVLLIGAAAQVAVPLPITPVPLTGQTFGVLLIGGAYGAARGAVTLLAYLVLGSVGAPIFASGDAGIEALRSPTGGYLLGMLLAAVVVGWAAQRGWDRRLVPSVLAMVAGNAVIYLVGASWLAVALDLDVHRAIALGVAPFLIGDILKIACAGSLLPACWRGIDGGQTRD